ncbi:MAG: hypothetical protein QOE62_3393 [Actinomycetota bacterium]|nr:hypothetical protein [Actinomycetota bacterium]
MPIASAIICDASVVGLRYEADESHAADPGVDEVDCETVARMKGDEGEADIGDAPGLAVIGATKIEEVGLEVGVCAAHRPANTVCESDLRLNG